MTEYIDKETAIKIVEHCLTYAEGDMALKHTIEDLNTMPTYIRHDKPGHWIDVEDPEWDGEWGKWQCSECKVKLMSMAIDLNGTYLYCPKCGTRMDGEINREEW